MSAGGSNDDGQGNFGVFVCEDEHISIEFAPPDAAVCAPSGEAASAPSSAAASAPRRRRVVRRPTKKPTAQPDETLAAPSVEEMFAHAAQTDASWGCCTAPLVEPPAVVKQVSSDGIWPKAEYVDGRLHVSCGACGTPFATDHCTTCESCGQLHHQVAPTPPSPRSTIAAEPEPAPSGSADQAIARPSVSLGNVRPTQQRLESAYITELLGRHAYRHLLPKERAKMRQRLQADATQLLRSAVESDDVKAVQHTLRDHGVLASTGAVQSARRYLSASGATELSTDPREQTGHVMWGGVDVLPLLAGTVQAGGPSDPLVQAGDLMYDLDTGEDEEDEEEGGGGGGGATSGVERPRAAFDALDMSAAVEAGRVRREEAERFARTASLDEAIDPMLLKEAPWLMADDQDDPQTRGRLAMHQFMEKKRKAEAEAEEEEERKAMAYSNNQDEAQVNASLAAEQRQRLANEAVERERRRRRRLANPEEAREDAAPRPGYLLDRG